MAYLVPQRFQEMLTRASEMGESRILAGMHSPLDVMGGRMLATATVVYNLNKPENAALKRDAYRQAQSWLAAKSGATGEAGLDALAHAAPLANDRFADSSANSAYVLNACPTVSRRSTRPTSRRACRRAPKCFSKRVCPISMPSSAAMC
ncbi:hypothetical protein AJ87_22245 [Rhizobium yanglingense]|nr:hypothetical protein AJ87_22245 [Rhizobium yanglingense]